MGMELLAKALDASGAPILHRNASARCGGA
jgi:hypothetical protein